MTRNSVAATVVAAMILGAPAHGTLAAPDPSGLTGRWTLNRSLSQIPREVGFGMDLRSVAGSGAEAAGAAAGEAAALAGIASLPESQDDATRRERLVDEVRNPSPRLTIAQTETAVTITDDRGRSRTFHADGKEESQPIDEVPVATTTRWDGTRLEVRYVVERNRELRYTYSAAPDPARLVVNVKFIGRGGNDTVTLVYEPTRVSEPALPERATPPDALRAPLAPPPALTRPPDLVPAAGQPAPGRQAAPIGAQGPDAELKGLTTLGVVVEDLSPQAATCGLSQAPIETAVSKSFSDAGFKVIRDADDDTYVYIHINTTSVSAGLCVSRYDVFLYTHTTATLSYQATPVLVQVSLLHKGGLAGGAPSVHGDTVVRNVKQYADEFAGRIRSASR